MFFDIETEPLPYNEFPAPEEARAPISLITIHDSLTNEYTTFGTKEFTGELPNDLKVFYIHCEDEYELLESFLRYIEKTILIFFLPGTQIFRYALFGQSDY